MMHQPLIAVLSAALLTPAASAAPYVVGADARPVARDGRLVTDAYDDDTGEFVANVRHFGYLLGQSPGNPYFTADPGFNAILGSGLPAGQLRFDVVRHLARWDGAGVARFTPAAVGHSLRFSFGATDVTVDGTIDTVDGLPLGNVSAGGSIHRHLNAFLQNGGSAPEPGLYFTALRLSISGGALPRGDAIYVAYNNGLPDADFRRGMAYLADPIPGDTNFDARVDFTDLVTLAQNYQANADASFFNGDFDGDRAVGFNDLVALAQRYGQGTTDPAALSFSSDWALAQAIAGVVPEPLTFGVLPAAFMFARRRRD